MNVNVYDYSHHLIAVRKYLNDLENAAALHQWPKAISQIIEAQRELAAMNLALVAMGKPKPRGESR